MNRLVFLGLGLALLAGASTFAAQGSFERLKAGAARVEGLGPFLDRFIGECNDPASVASCRERTNKFRGDAQGKRHYLVISEDAATMVSPGPCSPDSGECVVNITPFFGSGGYGLSNTVPSKTDPGGNPILPYLRAKGHIPAGSDASDFARLFSMRSVRVEVIFSPVAAWAIPRKGGGKILGVRARFEAIQVTNGRTGDVIALWTGG